jgi:K+-sensing histidine kinase KdpD
VTDPTSSDAAPPPREPPHGDGATSQRGSHLGFVTHEIRNPVSSALWAAELMVRMKPEDRSGARGDKMAGLCLRSVSRIRLLVEDFLLSERLDAGGYPLRLEPVPLAEALEVAVGRAGVAREAVSVEVQPDAVARADRILLERALDALLACAGRDGVLVRAWASRRGDEVEVRVTGGPTGSLEDPRKGAPSDQAGRALALPMARRVAVALGGVLTVEPEGYLLRIPAA